MHNQLNKALEGREAAEKQKIFNDSKRQQLIEEKEQVKGRLSEARENLVQAEQGASSLVLRLELLQTKVDYLNQSIERDSKRLEGLKGQQVNLEKTLSESAFNDTVVFLLS